MSNQDFNPETHVRGDDGQIYERKIVQATGVAVGAHGEKTAMAAAMEKAMQRAIQSAHDDGVGHDPQEISRRMTDAREKTLNEGTDQA